MLDIMGASTAIKRENCSTVEMSDVGTLTVSEIAMILRIGKASAYKLVKEPGFPSIKIGKKIRVLKSQFWQWLANRKVA